MTFLGAPCQCGWSLDDVTDGGTVRACTRCRRRYEQRSYGWVQTTPIDNIVEPKKCQHGKFFDQHCCDGTAYDDHS